MEIFDVFISYRRADGEAFARKLNEFLSGHGLRVFFDIIKMEHGHAFPDQLKNAVEIAPHYILIATPGAFDFHEDLSTGEKDYVLEEMRFASAAFNKDKDRTIHVLNTPDCAFKPEHKLSDDINALAYPTWQPLDAGGKNDALFENVFRDVTEVSRLNILFASQRWYENSRNDRGRFAKLEIDRAILPNVSSCEPESRFPVRVYNKEAPGGQTEPRQLFEALAETNGSVYLIGEGGVGKTTALMRMMEKAYGEAIDPRAQIPVFIDLSYAPDTYGRLYENGFSSFIRRSVFQQIRMDRTVKQIAQKQVRALDEAFTLPPEIAVDPVSDLLSGKKPAPEYLLLLDGLNEVSVSVIEETGLSVYAMIIGEIKLLIDECPNVRVVLTSRSDVQSLRDDRLTRLYLSGVDAECMRVYLHNAGCSPDEIECAVSDAPLFETLQIPLFLKLYARLGDRSGATARGEILRRFFHECGDRLEDYTAVSRTEQIEENVINTSGTKQDKRLTAKMQRFILDFILPEVSFRMALQNRYRITAEDFCSAAKSALTDFSPTGVCGAAGKAVFTQYKGLSARDNVCETAKRFHKLGDEDEILYALLDCCTISLGLLYEDGEGCGLIHQHFRDYFAAVKCVNTLRIAARLSEKDEKTSAFECMRAVFADKPIGLAVRRFIGESLGEHKNKPFFAEDRWQYGVPVNSGDRNLIKRVLDLYRGKYDTERDDGYTLYSLIQILKEVREDLSGEDFSGLDLSRIALNPARLAQPGVTARFKNAKLSGQTLMPTGHSSWVISARFSPNEKTVLTAAFKEVKLWDLLTCQSVCTRKHDKDIDSVCFSPDGRLVLLTFISYGSAELWNAQTLCDVSLLQGHTGQVNAARFSPVEEKAVTVSEDKTAILWDTSTCCAIGTLRGHKKSVCAVCFNSDGDRIVTGSEDKTAKLWDTETCCEIGTLRGHKGAVNAVCFSPDGKTVATASSDKTVKLWNVSDCSEIGTLSGHSGGVGYVCFAPKGNKLLSLSYTDGTARLWDAASCSEIRSFDCVSSACFSPDGRILLTGIYNDYTVKLWDVETLLKIGELTGHKGDILSVCCSVHGNTALTSSVDGSAFVWGLSECRLIGRLLGYSYLLKDVQFSFDGTMLATAFSQRCVKIWDPSAGRPLGLLSWYTGDCRFISFSPNGKMLLIVFSDQTARLWDVILYRELGVLRGHTGNIHYVEFSSDSKTVLTASDDKTVRLWDVTTCAEIGILRGHTENVNTASFRPDGKTIVTASDDGTARLWDVSTCAEIGLLRGHAGKVNTAWFSPNGKTVVTASDDCTARLWDAANSAEIGVLRGHTGTVWDACFSPDGKTVATASDDRTVRQWDAETFQETDRKQDNRESFLFVHFSPDGEWLLARCRYGSIRLWRTRSGREKKFAFSEMLLSRMRIHFSPKGITIISAKQNGMIKLWFNHKLKYVLVPLPGLWVMGCDLRDIHPDSRFTEEEKALLTEHGAVII